MCFMNKSNLCTHQDKRCTSACSRNKKPRETPANKIPDEQVLASGAQCAEDRFINTVNTVGLSRTTDTLLHSSGTWLKVLKVQDSNL